MSESTETPLPIVCQFRKIRSSDHRPICQVAADLADVSIDLCEVNDDQCRFCLSCEVAPQNPNRATASAAFRACVQSGREPPQSVKAALSQPNAPAITLENTPCILRGMEIRQTECKPCQAGSKVPVMVPVFACQKLGECTLKNTGMLPKIQGCVTCQDRVAVREVPMYPLPVLNAIRDRPLGKIG